MGICCKTLVSSVAVVVLDIYPQDRINLPVWVWETMDNSGWILRFLASVILFIKVGTTKVKQVCGASYLTEMTNSQPIIISRYDFYPALMVKEKIIGQRGKEEN